MYRKFSRTARILQRDGIVTLLLSNGLLLLSAGISLLPLLWHILRVAASTPHTSHRHTLFVVFGHKLHRDTLSDDYRLRLERAHQLHTRHPEASFLIVGGTSAGNRFSEAAAGRDRLMAAGIPGNLIDTEDQSRHTLENLKNARACWDRYDTPPVLITNRYHLARTSTLARGMGLEHTLCAAEREMRCSPRLATQLLLEAYYLHWYWVGRYWSTLMRNRHSLSRIS